MPATSAPERIRPLIISKSTEEHSEWLNRFFLVFLTRACLSFGTPDRCNLPFYDGQEDVCQREFTDRSNFRAHIKSQHVKKNYPVPAWLKRAIERRLSQLETESNRPCRPIVEQNPSDFIHETFNTSGTSGSSSSPQTEAGGSFGGSSPPQIEASGSFGGSFPTQIEASGLFGGSSPPQTEADGFFGGSSPPQTEAGGFFGGSSPLQVESTIPIEPIVFGSSMTPSGLQGVFRFHSFS